MEFKLGKKEGEYKRWLGDIRELVGLWIVGFKWVEGLLDKGC